MNSNANGKRLKAEFLGSRGLAEVASDLPLTCLDVGARKGFSTDLLPLSFAVKAIGFEPDVEECQRLNVEAELANHPWESLRYIPAALGPHGGPSVLKLYRQRGCSSLLEARQSVAAEFAHGEDFDLEGTLPIELTPLDLAAESYGFRDAAFMKIDIQGFEREVLRTGPRLLADSLLAIRSEVTFLPIYKDQPLLEDSLSDMRSAGFMPMGFEELHSWRRTTRVKYPRLAKGPIPFSKGQAIHGDMLFFRDPSALPEDGRTTIRAALLAIVYGYVDHGYRLLQSAVAADYLRANYAINVDAEIGVVSRTLSQLHRRRQWRQFGAGLKHGALEFLAN